VHFYLLQALGSHRGTVMGDDFVDVVLNANTGGLNDDENLTE
jgi:hypothetical protein